MSSNGNGVEAPGAETQKVEVPTIEVIEKWITRDVGVSISCLQAIHNDPNLRRILAVYFQGKIENAKNAQEQDPAQMGLFSRGPKGAA